MLTSGSESSVPFVFTDRSGFVEFTSGYYYNMHTNFKLAVSYLDINGHSDLFGRQKTDYYYGKLKDCERLSIIFVETEMNF